MYFFLFHPFQIDVQNAVSRKGKPVTLVVSPKNLGMVEDALLKADIQFSVVNHNIQE